MREIERWREMGGERKRVREGAGGIKKWMIAGRERERERGE